MITWGCARVVFAQKRDKWVMADKEPESPNPPLIIGTPERGPSKMELYEYHKNNGSLAASYDLYPGSRPRQSRLIAAVGSG